jgi:hypothetical protein
VLRPVISRCTSTAQRNASTTLPNSTSSPVAGGFDQGPAVLGDFGIDQLLEVGLELRVRPFLISAHQTRVARHIGREDRSKTADLAHVGSPAAKRRPDR